MNIKILGTGCPNCKKLLANVETAVAELGLDVVVEKVENIMEITSYGVMMTPALVIDRDVISAGKVLSSGQVKELLESRI